MWHFQVCLCSSYIIKQVKYKGKFYTHHTLFVWLLQLSSGSMVYRLKPYILTSCCKFKIYLDTLINLAHCQQTIPWKRYISFQVFPLPECYFYLFYLRPQVSRKIWPPPPTTPPIPTPNPYPYPYPLTCPIPIPVLTYDLALQSSQHCHRLGILYGLSFSHFQHHNSFRWE